MPIGEAGPIVAPLRLQYDRAASLGVPAHITLLYPFRPPHAAAGEIETLAELRRNRVETRTLGAYRSAQVPAVPAAMKDAP